MGKIVAIQLQRGWCRFADRKIIARPRCARTLEWLAHKGYDPVAWRIVRSNAS